MLATSTRIALADPESVLRPLCAHLVEHEAVISEQEGATVIVLDASRARIGLSAAALDVTVEAPDVAALQEMKRAIASHVIEFAPKGAAPEMRWVGDGTGPALPADFRVLAVTGVETITPHMRRIRFRGENLARFDKIDALHVRLFIPPEGVTAPSWPMVGDDGLLLQPPAESRPIVRKYTIREIDSAAGTLAVDFVLHEDAGPGSAFAMRAKTGDLVGMGGPGGRGLKTAERYVFLADETGLPAAARMLENLPPEAVGQAFFEVANAGEEQPLRHPAGIAVTWLHRGDAAPGSLPLLQEAFAALDWQAEGPATYLWAAMEHGGFREIRAAARGKLRPERDQHLVVSYWRNGATDEEHVAAKKAEAAKA
ncbi:siderophore-interacting protein [Bosea sp. NBC_00550]|uniref:siderophore-interacting protein n=1 Tax=Bosea sp. NBC_00550 TaxID=2969621 RepID=UPI0022305742|nr:siderophore-interacting protein [Bosea sp. NBC_00550]UZF91414.1 siderophore-interacting protein [Bosea sp. NBC_00550]